MNKDRMRTSFLKKTTYLLLLAITSLLVGTKLFQLLNNNEAINEYYADTTPTTENVVNNKRYKIDKSPVKEKPPSHTETSEEETSHGSQSKISSIVVDSVQDVGNKNPTESSSNNFKLLSWNLDGLDMRDIEERTDAVVKTILIKKPDIVFLQEVIPHTLKILTKTCEGYMVLVGEYTVEYFNAILVRKSSVQTKETSLQFIPFPSSKMGRHYLIQPIKIGDCKIIVMTSHLESLRTHSVERKRQFQEVLNYMKKQSDGFNVIFGGDSNLRDKEVTEIGGIPQGMQDIWESCGREKSTEFTWDTIENTNIDRAYGAKLRFDRMFLRAAKSAKKLTPKSFTLIGKERLDSGMFPSDHWAVWMEFDIHD